MSTPRKPPRHTGFVLRQSSPLSSLADAAQEFSANCDELWIATAFVDELAVKHVVEPAVTAKAKVRFLTGTFGRVTRRRTFARLERLVRKAAIEARVWEGEFHIKLYIWRFGTRVIAWIGSANLTAGGLQREGELVLQIEATWGDSSSKRIRAPFDLEWQRSVPLDASFLAGYKESPRTGWLLRGASSKPRSARRARRRASDANRLVVVPVTRHYAEGSPVIRRVTELLGSTADSWYRGVARALRSVRRDDLCLLVDYVEKNVIIGLVTDTKPDGRGHVFSYDWLVRSPRPLAEFKRYQLRLDLGRATRAVRTQWLDRPAASRVVAELFGVRVASRVLGKNR